MHATDVDGLVVRLREPHDLSFLSRWGRVFRVFDEQDSGNLCFGVEGEHGRVFVKYAGARPIRFDGEPADAVARARDAADVYVALEHRSLVHLRETMELPGGFAMLFDWTDALPLGRAFARPDTLTSVDLQTRAAAVQQIFDFHAHAAARGWIAVDLYDGSVMLDPVSRRVVLCDVDLYRRGAFTNEMGRMWGSTRFMSPEEYERGELIDERTNLVALGALAHTLLGDDATRSREAWTGTDEQFAVAVRAMTPERERRWPSVSALAEAWRNA